MPTYEYECGACGKVHEVFHGISEKPPRKCPACGRRRLKRRIGSGAAVLFKGDGFYTTDYRSKEYKEKAKKESEAAGGKTSDKPSPSKDSSSGDTSASGSSDSSG